MAFHQACLHPFSHISRNEAPDLIHVLSSKSILPKSRLHNIIIEPKERLRSLLHPRIFTRKSSDKERVIAAGIEFRMDSALRENRHLVRVESVGDAVGTVLERELGYQAAFDDDVDLGAAGVRVWGVETAGADEAERHADSGADERWEDFPVCTYGVASFAGCHCALGWVVEIVDEVGIVGDEVDAFFCGWGELERLDQIFVAGDAAWSLDVWQCCGVVEGGWKREGKDAELGTDNKSGEQHVGEGVDGEAGVGCTDEWFDKELFVYERMIGFKGKFD